MVQAPQGTSITCTVHPVHAQSTDLSLVTSNRLGGNTNTVLGMVSLSSPIQLVVVATVSAASMIAGLSANIYNREHGPSGLRQFPSPHPTR